MTTEINEMRKKLIERQNEIAAQCSGQPERYVLALEKDTHLNNLAENLQFLLNQAA